MSHGAPYRPRRALDPSDAGDGPDDYDWDDQSDSTDDSSTHESASNPESVPESAADPEGSSDPSDDPATATAVTSPWSRPSDSADGPSAAPSDPSPASSESDTASDSPATPISPAGPDPEQDGTESEPRAASWNGRGNRASHRRRVGLLGAAAVTLMVIVLAIGYAAVALTGGDGRPAVVLGQDPPTSSAPTPTPTPPVSEDRLLNTEQAKFLAPKSKWSVARTQTGRTADSPVATCLQRPGAEDTPAESTFLRTLTASGEREMAVLHEASAYADRDQAVEVFGKAARELGGCTTEGAYLDSAVTIDSLANQALALQVAVTPAGDPDKREYHTVLVIRTGHVINIVDTATKDEFVKPQILAETMIPVVNVQCTDAVGLCAQDPKANGVVPPIGGEHPGLPVLADVPRLPKMTGHWAATDPTRDPKLPDGTSCERLGSTDAKPTATISRAYLVQDDKSIPQTYGWDLVLFTLKDNKQAASFVSDVTASIEDCEDRQRTADVGKATKFSGTGTQDVPLTGVSWPIRQQTGEDADTDYVDFRVAMVRAGNKVVYLFLPLEKGVNFQDAQWQDLVLRAGQRATQIT